jgi:hypothetical protein
MKKSTLVSWAVVFAFAIWGSLAYAEFMVANIQFPFKAAGTEFTAGKYRIEADLQSEQITLRKEGTGKAAFLPFTTRLSEREEALVVFDKQGEQYYLSEIYMPGIDGFELKAATGKHTHVKVKDGK